MMKWDIELGKQVSMMASILVIIVMFYNFKRIQKENLLFIIAFSLSSLIDIFCYFYYNITDLPTDTFYVVGILIIAFLLYLLYYLRLFHIDTLKKIQYLIILLFIINLLFQFSFESQTIAHFSFKILYANIILLLLSIILFLYQTFNSDKILEIKKYLPFWISVALLLFFVGGIPISFFRNLISDHIYFFILFILNMTTYSILILGISWNKQN